jgi:HAD superfamily hydrolase (TIGR01509 family)
LDGTLIDSVYDHVATWLATLKEEGLTLPAWKIHRHVGMSGKSFLKELLRESGANVRKLSLESLEKEHARKFSREISSLQPLPGARELLKHLSQVGVHWAIATTGARKQAKRLLQILELPPSVPLVTGDDVAEAKPSPDIFMLAAERLGTTVSESVIVGDSQWDLLAAARKNGLGVGLLCGGYSADELWTAGAIRVYEDPADLLLHLEDLGIPGK